MSPAHPSPRPPTVRRPRPAPRHPLPEASAAPADRALPAAGRPRRPTPRPAPQWLRRGRYSKPHPRPRLPRRNRPRKSLKSRSFRPPRLRARPGGGSRRRPRRPAASPSSEAVRTVTGPITGRHSAPIAGRSAAASRGRKGAIPAGTRRSGSRAHSSISRSDRDRPDYRPSFRPDRREERGSEPRQEGRDPRRDQAQREPRPQFDQRPRREPGFAADRVAPEAKAPTGGFFGWLKGLFGRSKPAVEAPAGRDSGGEPFGDEHRHRRRHRGGRGHGGGNPQGFLGERSPQGSEYENRGGDRHGGPRRRRHRGGQGRDRGGDPRSEGQQGGGAI